MSGAGEEVGWKIRLGSTLLNHRNLVRPRVPCDCCEGSGVRPLGDGLWDVLWILRSAKVPLSAADVSRELPDKVGVTAINNRLAKLVDLELAVFVAKDGKEKLFECVPLEG